MIPAKDREIVRQQVMTALERTAAGSSKALDTEVCLTSRGTGLQLRIRERHDGMNKPGREIHIIDLPTEDTAYAQRKAVSFASGILAMAAFRKMARIRAQINADKEK